MDELLRSPVTYAWVASYSSTMGWLRLVGSLKSQVSFAKEPHKRDYILQKRPVILRSLQIVAAPYAYVHTHICTYAYGVATISRLLKIIGLFCRTVSFIGLFCKRDLWFVHICTYMHESRHKWMSHVIYAWVHMHEFICTCLYAWVYIHVFICMSL